jgi:hypothetical protein
LLAELPGQCRGALRASTSRATVDNPQTCDRFQQNRLAYGFDWNGTLPAFTALGPALADDPTRYANLTHQQGSTAAWSRTGELWDDRYPNYSNQQEFYRNRYQQPLHRLDLKLAWDGSPAVAVSLDVLNLAGQGHEYRIGRHQEYVQSA